MKRPNLFSSIKAQIKKIYPTALDIRVILRKKINNSYESKIRVIMPEKTLNAKKIGDNPKVTVEKSFDAIKRQGDRKKAKAAKSFKRREVRALKTAV